MAKLPTRDDLGQMPSARSGRPIATYDTSAIAKGQIQLGKAITDLGATGIDYAKHQERIADYDTELAFQKFKWDRELELDESSRKVEPGQAGGFADEFSTGYKEKAKEFLSGVPESLRSKYDTKLFGAERELYRGAAKFGREEQKRSSIASLEDFRDNYLAKSGNLERGRAEYERLVEENPWLTPIDKDEQRRKGLRQLEDTHVGGLIDRGEGLDTIIRDLGGASEVDAQEHPEERTSKGLPQAAPEGPAERRTARAFVPVVNEAITAAAEKHGVDPGLLSTFARIESGGRPGERTGSYKGLFQLSESEFRKHGGDGDIYDAAANADAAAAKLKREAAAFESKYGRAPSALDLYMVHQQGEAGYAAHMERPDAPAWQNMAGTGEGRQKGAGWAKQAIWGNIPDDIKKRFPDGVESVTSQDFVTIWQEKVDRLGGGETRIASAGPASDAYAGPYRNLPAERRLELIRTARTKVNQEIAVVREEVRGFESLAEQGFAPQPGQLDALRAKVERVRDPETMRGFAEAEATLRWQDAARKATPAELDGFIRNETERLRQGGATAFDAKRVGMADKLLSTMRRELKDDPLGWADRVGLVAIQPVDFSTPEAAQGSLSARVTQADAVARRYGVEPKYLRADEAQALTSAIDQGGDTMLATVGAIAHAAGERAPDILGEVSKNSPTAAIVGGMVSETGMSPAARDAADGLALRKQPGFQSAAPPAKEGRKQVAETMGAALSGMPKTESAMIDGANAIYEIRARKQNLTEFDADVWQQGLRELVGERTIGGTVYGGIVENDRNAKWGGERKIILPPFLARDGWFGAIEAIIPSDLDAAGLGQPASGDGKPIAMSRVKGATLVQTGDGRYALSLGDPDAPGEEKWIVRQDNPDERFEIDLRRLKPRLQTRRPDLFVADTTFDVLNPETRQLYAGSDDAVLSKMRSLGRDAFVNAGSYRRRSTEAQTEQEARP